MSGRKTRPVILCIFLMDLLPWLFFTRTDRVRNLHTNNLGCVTYVLSDDVNSDLNT